MNPFLKNVFGNAWKCLQRDTGNCRTRPVFDRQDFTTDRMGDRLKRFFIEADVVSFQFFVQCGVLDTQKSRCTLLTTLVLG